MISTSVVAIRSPVWATGGSVETFSFPRLGSGWFRTQIRLPGVKPRQLSRSVRMSGGVESVTTQQSESVQSTGSESKAVNVIIKREGSGRVLPQLDCGECEEVESEWLGAELSGWLGGGSVLWDIQRCG